MTLYTIAKPVSSEYKIQSSKFLSFAFPVSSEEEVKFIIKEHQKAYFDATHVCYAYALGNHVVLKSHDAGEPAHTAGTPILNIIRSESITNTLVIVVRYFGGTKLGKSGLIQAYKTAAFHCLQNAEKIQFIERVQITVETEYEKLSHLLEILKKNNCTILDKIVGNVCIIRFEAPLDKELEIRTKLP